MISKNEFYAYLQALAGMPVCDETLIFEDLGIDGLEAVLLMESVGNRYNTNLQNYNTNKYHLPERDIANPFAGFRNIIHGKEKTTSFTALHLYNVVLAGKWFDPRNESPGN